jgi:hypothetical protein
MAQDLWYRSYQEGVKAFKSGDFVTAEQKLLAARNNKLAPRERGRKVLYYSQIRDEFLPEYYLAMTYAGLRRWSDALKFAGEAEKYLKNGDPEFQRLAAARVEADRVLNPPVLAANSTVPSPAPPSPSSASSNSTPAQVQRPNQPVEDPAAASRRNFDRLLADATRFGAAGQYAEARQAASQAKALGVDNSRADALLKATDIQDMQSQINTQLRARAWSAAGSLADRLAGLDPANPAIRRARQEAARGLAVDEGKRLERDGLMAFYRGDYQRALDTLGKVAADVKTPRVAFYLACSTAALGLIQDDKSKLQRAHELFQQARPKDNPFTVDRKYISPSIIRVLDAPAS